LDGGQPPAEPANEYLRANCFCGTARPDPGQHGIWLSEALEKERLRIAGE
jgi:hypothetical protein